MNNANWQKIYLDHSPKLLGICRRYVADVQTAEDLLQDSFIMAMQKRHQLKDENALFGWLKTIVVNNALQHLRKNSKEIFVSAEISEIPEPLIEMNNSSTEKNHVLAYDFTSEQLLKSIDSLPPHHRSVFNLYFIEKRSHAEIAKLLEININTSKSHLLRAKKSVQNYLLNNFVNHNTPKNNKKITQLLVFLGLGGLIWAQTFQSKFADFKISPSKEFMIPEGIKINNFTSFSSNKNIQKKLIIASTIFIILLLSIYINKGSFSRFNNNLPSEESSINIQKENHPETDSSSQLNPKLVQPNKAQTESLNEINLSSKTEIKKAVVHANKKTNQVLEPKDSVQNSPKKVIIVKKIIQRDTIFIEREN